MRCKCSDDIPRRIIDQGAETVAEIGKACGMGRKWVSDFARARVAAGEWETVFKRVGTQLVPAYRKRV